MAGGRGLLQVLSGAQRPRWHTGSGLWL